ncbi:MAG TPA: hypothetical protein VK961_05875 [Chthoniobacter sp.]|nr:hypothetical protein [Chthoniobacter sp.]
MKPSRLLPLIAACLAFGSVLSPAEEPQILHITIPKGDKLAVRIPPAWKQTVIQPKPELPPTVKIESADHALSLQLTFIPDLEGRFATKEGVDRLVTGVNQRYVAGSVEKRLTLTQLVSKVGHGCYSTFTDADLVGVPNPQAGQFRNALSGVIVVQKQIAAFTLLSNSTTSPEYQQAIQIISDGISPE